MFERSLLLDSIIFDLDGTLWDSRETVVRAWNQVIRKNKNIRREIVEEDLKRTMGLQFKEIGEILFPYLDAQIRAKLLEECSKLECDFLKEYGGMMFPNVEEVLEVLSEKYKLFIVSNCQDGYIEAFYLYHKLGKYFLDFENPGRTGLTKGENIKLIMKRNYLQSPVYVGDTEGDKKSAEEAGIPFVYAKYGFGEVEQYAFCIEKFEDLLNLPFK